MEGEAMTTKARIAALQWFHDRGKVRSFDRNAPSSAMCERMVKDGQLAVSGRWVWSLTDKGRQDLHEATK